MEKKKLKKKILIDDTQTQDELSYAMLINFVLKDWLKEMWAEHQEQQERIHELLFSKGKG